MSGQVLPAHKAIQEIKHQADLVEAQPQGRRA